MISKRISVIAADKTASARVEFSDAEGNAEIYIDGQVIMLRLISLECLYEALHEVFGERLGPRPRQT